MMCWGKTFSRFSRRALLAGISLLGVALYSPIGAFAAITVEPSTWNIIGLDSNTPAFGPYRFPVGAKVCSTTAVTDVPVSFNWDTGGTDNGTYLYLRPGSNSSLTIPSIAAGSCADAFFEVEVNSSPLAYNQTRRFHITANGVSTPTPRELKVERLVSQGRNAITDIQFGTSLSSLTSVPNGGSMDLVVGNTYYIKMVGYTATQGYEQLESFINFPNTIFQILSVNTTYSADTSAIVSSPSDKLYADGCGWDNDPVSPSYLSCYSDGKAGGSVAVTYQVKILNVSSSRETLNSLIHDFSGSSFHYNSDFSTTARFANIVDPTTVTINKNFAPDPNNVGGVSSLTFTLSNPNPGALGNISFTDIFPSLSSIPAAPGNMSLANTVTTNTCGGTLTDSGGSSLNAGDDGIRLTGATIPANGSCSVVVNVTTSSTGTYSNISQHVFVGTIDTGKFAADSLTVNTDPPPGAGVCGMVMASWGFPTGFTPSSPAPSVNNITTATAAPGAGLTAVASTTNHSGLSSSSWSSNGSVATGTSLATTNNDYFQFALNTTGYTKIYLTFWAQRTNSGPQGLAVYYGNSPDRPEGGTQLSSSTLTSTSLAAKDTWYQFGASPNLLEIPVTSNLTYVRIYAYNAGNSNPSSDIFIDDVSFDGCRLPTMPTIAKEFLPATIASGATSTLTFTLTNPNPVALTGASFSDALPAGMSVANPPNASTTCGGTPTWTSASGATNLTFGTPAGGIIPASGSCTVQVDVIAPTGTYSNTSGFLSTTEGGTNKNSIATATLTALTRPTIAKNFAPDPIFINNTSTLTFLVTNPNQNDALSGVAFTDTFPIAPGSMIVAPTPNATTSGCGTPTFAPAAGAGSISFSNGTIAAGGTCTVTVDVTAPVAGTYANTSGAVSHTLNGSWSGGSASDSLTVETPNPAIALLKQVASTNSGPWSSYLAVTAGGSVYYRFTVENLGDVPLSPFSVSDPGLPAPLSLASCTWKDGDNNTLTAPLTLPVADADNGHIATCILGPAVAATGSHPNTATASGTYGATTVTGSSTATYATSALTLAKNADKSYFLAAGETINYSYVVSNTGSAILTGPLTVSVTDNLISAVICPAITTVGNNNIDFDPGESITCTASYTVSASDVSDRQVLNVARAMVSGVSIGNVYTPQVTRLVPLGPDLSVTKTNSVGGTAATNTPFTWTLTVSNAATAGPTAFTNGQTLLTDHLPTGGATYSVPAVATNIGGTAGIISCAIDNGTKVLTCTANGPVTIPTGGGFSIAVTTTPTTAGSLVNPVTPGGICRVDPGTIVTEIDETNNNCADTVTVTTPAVTLAKSANKPYFVAAGETLTYTYKVRNTGATPITGPVTVADNKTAVTCPAVSTVGDLDADLDPGEELTCTSTAPYTILAADVTARQVTNTATATLANAGLPVSSPQVTLTVPIGPDLSVVKTHPVATPIPGVPFDWTLTVTNAAIAGYAAIFDGTLIAQTLLTDNLPAGQTYSVPATATNTGGTTGTIDCAVAADTLTCSTSGVVSIPPGGGFTIAVAVTAASGGTLTNPSGGGICRIDPTGTVPGPGNGLVLETNEANNNCSDSVLVGMPSITMLKTVQPIEDPVNGTTNPKAIPGALMQYTFAITNFGYGPTDAGTLEIVDTIPANLEMYVNDINGVGSGPVRFIDGANTATTAPSGLGYSFAGLGDSGDKLTFSSDGTTFNYTPTADGNGCDPAVKKFKVSFDNKTVLPYDIFAGTDGTHNPTFTLLFRARIK